MSRARVGFLAIMGGTAGSQLLALAAAPVITRLYSPADLGLFTVVAAMSLIVGTVAALRFELAVPLPRSEREAHSLVALGALAAALVGVLGVVAALIFGDRLAGAMGMPELARWIWAVPLIGTTIGWFLLLNQLALRHGRFGSVGRRNLLQGFVLAGGQVAAGFLGFRPGGLVAAYGASHLAGTLSLLRGSGLKGREAVAGRRRSAMLRALRTYRRFPLLLAPSALLNVAGLQIPVLLVSFHYGPEVTGWLGLTQRVLALPVALVGVAVGQVYLSELARGLREREGGARELFGRASWRLALFGAGTAVAVAVLAPWVFPLVFGSEWAESGSYARALAIGLGLQLVAVPLSQTLIALGRQGTQLVWDTGRLVVAVAAVQIVWWLGAPAGDAVLSLGVALAVTYGALWGVAWHAVRKVSGPDSRAAGSAAGVGDG